MKTLSFASGLFLAACSVPALAQITTYDQDVTPGVIFGTGVANGGFTLTTISVGADERIEIGLRGRLRFDANGEPTNTFNSLGNGTYVFQAGTAPLSGSPPSWQAATTPVWSFDWSVNVELPDTDPGYDAQINDYTYQMTVDFDPSPGQGTVLSFDPITVVDPIFWDHAFGTNATADGAGVQAGNFAAYNTLAGTNNVVQNSVNYEFLNLAPFDSFDPNSLGTYTISLAVFSGNLELGRSTIDVQVIPEPSTYAAIIVALSLGVVVIRRRWRRAA